MRACLCVKRTLLWPAVAAAIFICLAAGPSAAGEEFWISRSGQPTAIVVLGERNTSVERHAAEELVKYVELMAGCRLKIIDAGKPEATKSKYVILIGRPETSVKIRLLCNKKSLKLSAAFPGLDGFVIRTLNAGKPQVSYLIIGGSMDRGTLYGVYHLLEKAFHVGFFEDGEHVPKRPDLRVQPLSIVERPAFKIRQFMNPSGNAYVSRYWLYPQWTYECDFSAKSKQNLLNIDIVHDAWWSLRRKTEESLGAKHEARSEQDRSADQFEFDLLRRIHDYVRNSLDSESLGPTLGAGANISREFRDANPKFSYVEQLSSLGQVSEVHIDPRTKEFSEYVERYIRLYNKLLGDHNYYFIGPIGGESQLMVSDPDLNKTIRTDFAKGIIEGLSRADPDGVWYAPGWTYLFGAWSPEYVKQLCDAVPKEKLLFSDQWAEAYPMAEAYEFFRGKDWLLGTVHALGSDNSLYGDMRQVIEMYREVVKNPKASNCVGTAITPEMIGCNPLYWDLLLKATWSPVGLSVDGHLRDYALRRYGADSAARMVPALRNLYESVYGKVTYVYGVYTPTPLYRGSNLADLEHVRDSYLARSGYATKLRQALDTMLSESGRQAGNKLYDNDLTDVCKQYVAEHVNYYTIALYEAFKVGDRKKFEACASYIDTCLDAQALILSSNSYYYLEKLIRQDMDFVSASGSAVSAETAYIAAAKNRRRLASPDGNEYCTQDRFELVKHYYRPKMRAYIDTLRKKMEAGERSITEADVMPIYRQVAKTYWESDACNLTEKDIYKGSVAQAAREVLDIMKAVKEPKTTSLSKTPLFENADFEAGALNWKASGNVWTRWTSKDLGLQGKYAMGGTRLDPDIARGTGVLTSTEFAISGERIEFLIAGYDADEQEDSKIRHGGRNRVELVDADTGDVLRVAEEPASYMFVPACWDVSDLEGRQVATHVPAGWDVTRLEGRRVFIRAIDENPAYWGWIAIDDFCYVGRTDPNW